MRIAQGDFASAVLDPAAEAPAGLSNPDGSAVGRRFNVYRNNVVVGLADALETAFPVICRLLGKQAFRTLAITHARQHPPRGPLMMFYGEDLPAFLERFKPVAQHRFLPDMARLELALRHAYHAADAKPVAPEQLAVLTPEELVRIRLRIAPALRMVRSRWPVGSIWLAAQGEDKARVEAGAEDVLVTRPGYDPRPTLLPRGGAAFVERLLAGDRVTDAVDAAMAETAAFDLAPVLGVLLAGQAIIGFEKEDRH